MVASSITWRIGFSKEISLSFKNYKADGNELILRYTSGRRNTRKDKMTGKEANKLWSARGVCEKGFISVGCRFDGSLHVTIHGVFLSVIRSQLQVFSNLLRECPEDEMLAERACNHSLE